MKFDFAFGNDVFQASSEMPLSASEPSVINYSNLNSGNNDNNPPGGQADDVSSFLAGIDFAMGLWGSLMLIAAGFTYANSWERSATLSLIIIGIAFVVAIIGVLLTNFSFFFMIGIVAITIVTIFILWRLAKSTAAETDWLEGHQLRSYLFYTNLFAILSILGILFGLLGYPVWDIWTPDEIEDTLGDIFSIGGIISAEIVYIAGIFAADSVTNFCAENWKHAFSLITIAGLILVVIMLIIWGTTL